jgi:hypothetical protein
MPDELPFEPEIAAAARAIERTVAAGENDPLRHAWHLANAVEQLLERHFPDLTTAAALDPQATVETLLELYAAIHEDTAAPGADVSAPVAELP